MISAVYILHRPDTSLPFLQNDLLIHRAYHNDVPTHTTLLENFCYQYSKELPDEHSPFLLARGINHIYISRAFDIVLLAVSRQNSNAMLTVVFLHDLYELLEHYLTRKPASSTAAVMGAGTGNMDQLTGKVEKQRNFSLDRDKILDNSNIIHELLDECVDFGVIQNTDFNILKEYIKVEVNRSKLETPEADSETDSDTDSEELENGNQSKQKQLLVWGLGSSRKKKNSKNLDNIRSTHNQAIHSVTQQDTMINLSVLRTSSLAINWRPKGIFYAKNEIYIDLIEECDFYYDLGSDIIKRNEILGRCEVKCYLSGMPICKIEFNEKHISGIEEDEDYENVHIDKDTGNILPVDSDEDEEGEGELLQDDSAAASNRGKHIPIRNIQFHQCVELSTIYKKNLVNFTPPDDKFTLLTYDVEQQKQVRKLPLIKINPIYKIIQETRTLQIMCSLSTQFKKRMKTQDLLVKIPIDPKLFPLIGSEENFKFKAQKGEVSFKIDTSQLLWQVGEVKGNTKDIKMMAELQLVTNPFGKDIDDMVNRRMQMEEKDDDELDGGSDIEELDKYYGVNKHVDPDQSIQKKFAAIAKRKAKKYFDNDIHISFVIPQLSYSGLKLIYLRVDEKQMKYSSFPWVRYKTETGNGQRKSTYRFKLGLKNFILV